MTRYVGLLRGINVGGKNKVAMADLRALVERLGHTDVTTYINSGNVVFTNGSPEQDDAALAAAIEERLAADLGLNVAVLVRSHDELGAALAANPFPDAVPARLLLTFLKGEPDAASIADLNTIESGDDEIRVVGTTAYLHCPDGIGRSKLAGVLGRRREPVGTARNLSTVRKLYDMTAT